MTSVLVLAGFLAVCFGVAVTGVVFRPGAWYRALRKPGWTPPDRLFAPVWTVLYMAIAVAGWMVWRRSGFADAAGAYLWYALQLLCNGLWSWLFFGLRRPDLALLDIGALALTLIATIVAFWSHHAGAALLLIPYLVWVGFAAVLNYSIWRLNA